MLIFAFFAALREKIFLTQSRKERKEQENALSSNCAPRKH